MGVPKFFRYISERYPCLSELIKEHEISDFDNMYLDMNGIIHTCSHPDDSNPHFRITEERIFAEVFRYIGYLFQLIRPKKLFYMAIDGVAPRAKMNQQRGRRFRSAREAEQMEAKARENGEVLPTDKRFDSNCITPGTVFMARLHEQLRYFVKQKITTDKAWASCKIVLSGHETPGEGEHKIMDYIRYLKTQPDHDPNTRHCLYGMDADLIMLGLCSHEPNFSLLREEVKFGKHAKKASTADEANFYLLHLSLMRDYLEQEFLSLKEQLSFEYDLERIIDDWVLMGFLVGNDFIPPLPNLHIHTDSLPILYNTYKTVLPQLQGYINEGGKLNLERFEKFLLELSTVDRDNFQEAYADLKFFQDKTGRRPNEKERKSYNHVPNDADTFDVDVEEIKSGNPLPMSEFKSDLDALIAATDDMALDEDLDKELECFNIDEDMDSEENEESQFRFEFSLHKRDYYMNKLEFAKVTPEVLRSQAECYVRAIQWVLNYYYQGCASWSWFYPHHYAPYISDVVNFTDMDLKFDMAQPLRPFEQLLAVLPAASKDLLPTPFHSLMTSDTSPIHVYYPIEFETDLNGKKNEWEAIVLIPFIDEGNLLSAIKPCYDLLTPDEIKRNTFGPMLMYDYTSQNMGEVVSPAYFPKISECHAVETRVWNEDICVPPDKVVRGPLPNPLSHMYFPGVPTFKHLPFKAEFVKAKVKVFDFPSRNDNVIIHVEQKPQEAALEEVATQLLGHIVWVGWPHLTKAKVMSIADEEFIFTYTTSGSAVSILKEEMHKPKWDLQKQSIEAHHMCRLGIDVGDITTVVNCAPITGYQYVLGGEGQLVYKENWSHITSPYALHMVLPKLAIAPGSGSKRFRRLQDAFPAGDTAFLLSGPYYACMAQVIDSSLVGAGNGRIKISVLMEPEPDISPPSWRHWRNRYMQPRVAAAKCGISSLMLARLTSSIFVIPGDKVDAPQKSIRGKDIGLNLKFTKKNEETTGYTHQEQNRWSYSERCVDLINAYSGKFHGMFMRMEKLMNRDSVYERELFPDPEEGSLEEVLAWLKEQPHKDSSIRECGTECLDPEEMIYIRNLVDSQLGGADVDTSKRITLQVKPHILFKPELHSGNVPPDPLASKYMMYDRVVNVNPSSMVPLGYRGTVTGISNLKSTVETVKISDKYNTEPVYRILFDKSFPGGNNTDGITGNRFYNMLGYNLLNMSHGRANHEKANDKVTIKQPNVDVPPASQNNNLRANDGHHSAFANYTSPTKNQMSNSFNKPPSSFVSQPPAAVQLKPKVEYPQPAMPKEDPRTQMLRSMLRIDDKQQKLPQDAQPPHARPQKQVVPPKHQDRPVQQMSPQKLPRNELLSKIAPQFSQPKQQQSETMQQMRPPKQVQNQVPPQMLMPQFLQQQQSQLMQQMPPTSKPMQQMLPSKQQQNQQMPPLNQLQNQPMQQMLPLKQQQSQAMQQMPPSSQSLIHTLPLNQQQSQPMQQMLPPKQQQNQPPQVQQPPRQQAQQQRTGGGGGSAYQSSQQAFLNALLAAPQNNQLPFPAMLVTTDNNKSAPTIAASAPPAGPNNKVISTPFVPLQAVTRQRNVSSSVASKNYKKGFHKTTLVPAANSPAVPAAPANHTEVIQDPDAKNVTKKKTRRSKKSRIAANFGQVQ